MLSELKPCPFCGGKAKLRKEGSSYYVSCSKCGARGTRSLVKKWHSVVYIAQGNAIEAWNNRVNTAKDKCKKTIYNLESATAWVRGESVISNVEELLSIADHYNINLPRYSHHFLYSENPNHLVATGAWRGLSNFLTKLANRVREVEKDAENFTGSNKPST